MAEAWLRFFQVMSGCLFQLHHNANPCWFQEDEELFSCCHIWGCSCRHVWCSSGIREGPMRYLRLAAQTWQLEFDPWKPLRGRGGNHNSISHPLTSTCAHVHPSSTERSWELEPSLGALL